jgi:hypothetical protein
LRSREKQNWRNEKTNRIEGVKEEKEKNWGSEKIKRIDGGRELKIGMWEKGIKGNKKDWGKKKKI